MWEIDCPAYAIKILTTMRDRTCFAVSLYDAVDSVACLECGLEDSGSDVSVLAGTQTLSPFETNCAKETRAR